MEKAHAFLTLKTDQEGIYKPDPEARNKVIQELLFLGMCVYDRDIFGLDHPTIRIGASKEVIEATFMTSLEEKIVKEGLVNKTYFIFREDPVVPEHLSPYVETIALYDPMSFDHLLALEFSNVF